VLERAAAAAGVAIFVVTAVVAGCLGTSHEREQSPRDTGTADIGFTIDASVPDTYFEFADAKGVDTSLPREDPPDAGPLPMLPCGDSGEDAKAPWDVYEETSVACPLPPSYCVDPRWLASYVNGVCEDGGCQYWRVYQDCRLIGGSSCFGGHCTPPIVK